jgi:hypothetical protein
MISDAASHMPSVSALRTIHGELVDRLRRENSEFRTLLLIEQAIASLEGQGAPLALDGEILPMLARRRRGRPTQDGDATPLLHTETAKPFVSQRAAAEQALLDRGEPATIKELLVMVAEHGAQVRGVRPQATLSSNLSQDPRFGLVNYRGEVCWWLAGRALPGDAAPARVPAVQAIAASR